MRAIVLGLSLAALASSVGADPSQELTVEKSAAPKTGVAKQPSTDPGNGPIADMPIALGIGNGIGKEISSDVSPPARLQPSPNPVYPGASSPPGPEALSAPKGVQQRTALRRAKAMADALKARPTEELGSLNGGALQPAPTGSGDAAASGDGGAANTAASRDGGAGNTAASRDGGAANAAASRDGLDLIAAASAGYADSFKSLDLHVGRTQEGSLAVLDAHGQRADVGTLAVLKEHIDTEPKALMKRHDFFAVIDRADYAHLKLSYSLLEEKHSPEFRDIGLSGERRDFIWTAACTGVSGECNRYATEPSYRANQEVSPETLRSVSTQLNSIGGDDGWAAYVRQQESEYAEAKKKEEQSGSFAASAASALDRLKSKHVLQMLSDMVASVLSGVGAGERVASGASEGPIGGEMLVSKGRATAADSAGIRPRRGLDQSLIDAAAVKGAADGSVRFDSRRRRLAAYAGAGAFLLLVGAWLSRRRRARAFLATLPFPERADAERQS